MLTSAVRVSSGRSLLRSSTRSFASVVDAAGLKVAAVDNGQPTSSVTLLVKAGSRYESKPGLAHALKNFGFKNTVDRSSLRIVREAELYGGVLSSSHSRELIAYNAEFLRGDEPFFVDLLCSILTSSRFTRYELEESVIPVISAESGTASSNPGTHAIELAHALAFRSGLGASLFAQPHAAFTVEDIKAYADSTFSKGNVAVLGTGISQENLAKLVQKHLSSIGSASNTSAPATTSYFGGETRVPFAEGAGHAPHTVFIGYGAVGPTSPELAVLAHHISPASSVKWSQGTSALAAELPAGTIAQTVLLPYSDATLFGVLVQGHDPAALKNAAQAAVKALKGTSGLKDTDLKKAIAKAKFSAASVAEQRDGLISSFGPQLLAGANSSLDDEFAKLDGTSANAVSKAASTLLQSKPTLVVIGDTYRLPHADELGF